MTADVVQLRNRGGRPSNAALYDRLAGQSNALEDLRDELAAILAEDLDHARELLRLTRSAMRAVAHGHSPANDLVDLEHLIHRLTYQRSSAAAHLRADQVCPCGETVRHVGCGAAA